MRWPAEALWEAVSPLLPGFTVEILPELDSSNSELMRRARAGLTDPVLLVAEHQTAGRGRLGRAWASAPGDSLTFSLALPLAPADWSGLSLAVGVVCVVYAMHGMDRAAVMEALRTLPPSAIAIYLATLAVTHLFRAWRWEFLLRPLGVSLPLRRLLLPRPPPWPRPPSRRPSFSRCARPAT